MKRNYELMMHGDSSWYIAAGLLMMRVDNRCYFQFVLASPIIFFLLLLLLIALLVFVLLFITVGRHYK